MKLRRLATRTAVLAAAFAVALATASGPASAAVILDLGAAYTPKTAAEQAPSLRDCAGVPGGAVDGTAGWVFDQPVGGTARVAYSLLFGTLAGDSFFIGVNPDGVFEVDQVDPPGPPPAGVDGSLIGGGAEGVWVQTPEEWILIGGRLQIQVDSADVTTFDLTGVCVDAPTPSPSPSPSTSPTPTATPTPTAEPTESTAPTTPAPSATASSGTGGGQLPITGGDVRWIAAAGVLLVLTGAALLGVRRRTRTRS